MTICAVYARISQDRTGEQAGVERQLAECRELAARLGFTVGAEYVDNDASATSGKTRPQFEALLSARPAVVVTWHQDRLLRLTRDLERVIALDVPVYTVSAGTLDLSTPAGRAVARTVAAWSQYEGEQKAERQKASNRQRAGKGQPVKSARRFGYQVDGLTPFEPEAEALRQAYADFLGGKGIHAIAREWNASGPAPMRAEKWSTAAVRQLLKRPRNAGLLVYRGEVQPTSAITPIVSVETFDQAQAVLAHPDRMTGKRGPKVVKNWLVGLITCSTCGSTMRQHKGYYVCGAAADRGATGDGTRHVAVATHIAEAEAVTLLWSHLQHERERVGAVRHVEVSGIRAAIAEAQRQRREWQEQGTWAGADKTFIRQQVSALTDRLTALEGDLAAATVEGATADLLRLSGVVWSMGDADPRATFADQFEALTVEDKRRLFRVIPTPEVKAKVKAVPNRYHPDLSVRVSRLAIPQFP